MSRFLRFFRVFAFIIACAFSAFSAQAHYVQLIDGDYATSGSVPSQFDYISSNYPVGTQVLTSFPYEPGYGYGGHWTGPNCSGSKKIDHEGKIAASIPSSTMRLYACWKNILDYSGLYGNYLPKSVLLFDYNGGAEPLFGNLLGWSACNGLIGDMGVRFENKGDFAVAPNNGPKWIHLEGCSWMYVGGTFEQYVSFAPYGLPTRQGYTFDGFYKNQDGTGYAVGWFQNDYYFLHTPATVTTELPLPDNQFVSVYAKWVPNVYQVNLATGGSYGSGATPNPVYLRYGEGWYDTREHAEAGGNTGKLTNLTTAPSNGDLDFEGFYLGPGGTGQQITAGSRFLSSALTAITQNNMTIYPYWVNPTTWATLEIDDQGATTSSGYNVDNTWYSLEDMKLYSAVTGNYCMGGYRTQPDCGLVSINSVTKPVKNGWVFGGYYTAINGGGEPFGTDGGNNIWNFPSDGITQDMTIYAKWTTEYYPITLLNGSQSYTIYEKYNDGWYRKNGNQYVEITASIFENVNSGGAGLAVPGGDGFRGYYNAQGVQVIQSDGVIIADPIYDAPTTFTAQFNGSAAVQIRLNKGDEASWGNCGQDSITVVPGGEFPILECTPTMTGHHLDGYIDNETEIQYYSGIYPIISVVPNSNALPQELYAKWTRVVNKLQYDCDGDPVHAVQIVYNDPYVIWDGLNGLYGDCPSSGASEGEAGRKLFGWEVKESPNAMFARQYQVGEVVANWPSWNGGQYASSIFKPIYYVTLNHAGNMPEVPLVNTPSPNVVYFSNGKWYRDNLATDQITQMDVAPQKVGYNFDGYETESHANAGAFNNVSPTFINSIGVQLYAKWSTKEYRVDLESGGSGGTERLFYRIDKGWYTNSDFGGQPVTRIIKPTSIPSGKVFGGYYTAPNGGGERAIDADGNILYTGTGANSGAMNLIQLLGSDQTLYVKWDDEASVPEGENEKFIVHTTSMSANARFAFSMSAAGDFYVQWDANDDSTIQHIGRDNTNLTTYEHTYSAAAPDGRDIVIWGTPTGYNGESGHIGSSVITFAEGSGTPLLVAGVSGSLGGVFRTIGDGAAKNPSFYWTFSGCSNLNSLPENLFGYTNNGNYVGVTGSRPYMFAGTFDNTGLTSIPGNLFGRMVSGTYHGVSGAAEHMFEHVFSGTNITSIPSGLFAGISGAADYMFAATFALTNLNTDSYPIPDNLFAGVTGNAEGLFAAMFEGCANLKTVPSNLFINVSGTAKGMFGSTFMASGLTSLPRGLFSGVTGTAESESIFYQTFSYCSGLAGKYIPKDLFNLGGLTYNANNNMMTNIFLGTNLATSCDAFNLTHYQTDYDNTYWEGKVICAPAAVFSCVAPGNVGSGTAPNPIFVTPVDSGSVSFTFPSGANCTASHYTKNDMWTCDGNVCNNGAITWDSNGQTPFNGTWNGQQSVTFYMTYTPKEYSVSLNANGGSFGGNGVQTLYETYNTKWATTSGGTAITSLTSAQLPTRENWNFLGYWDTNAATDGTLMIAPDGTINASTTTLTANGSTWYARWSQSTGPFTVTYLCGDHGTGTPGTQTVNYNESMTLKAASVCTAATGYTFDKWKIIANGVEKNAGATYTWPLHSGSDIVAQWQPVETTITLNNQGGVWNDGVPTESRSLYTTYGAGVYRDAARQEGMGTNDYPLTYVGTAPYSPTKMVTLTLDFADSGATMQVGNQTYTGSMSLPILLPFVGYYTAANGGTQVIKGRFKADGTDEPYKGFITPTGMTTGAGYTTDQTWHAHWLSYTVSNMETAVPQRAGYVFNGWWTDGGTQITDANGDFIDGNLVINADTTWYAHWTECSHDFGSNPRASKTAMTAVDGMCRYHITCDTDPGVPLGVGYSQYGGTNATGEFDFTISPSSTDDLPGCSARVYNIEYNNVEEHGGTMPSGDWYTYTYGGKTINAVPTSPTEVFDSWCDDLSNASTCSATKTIGATEYGDKIYYAKWDDECQRGYERLAHDVMMSQVYDDNDSWHWAVPNYTTWYLSAGTCVPKIYHVKCNKNCGDDTCAACLEDFVMDGYNWHLGGGYNVKDFCVDSSGFNTWIFGGFTPVRARVSGDPENGTNVFSNCNNGTGIEPNYIWLNSYYKSGTVSSMLARLYSTVGDYDTGNYNHLLQSLAGDENNPNTSFGREHYTFDGLWTEADGGIQYIDANGNFANGNGTAYNKVPWPSYSYNNYDARAFQNFFFGNNIAESTTPVSGGGRTFDVYAHWIPDVYTITLNKNGGGAGISQIYEKWNTVDGWSSDNSTFVSANNFTLSSSQLPIKSKYNFNGYWTNSSCDGSGVQIIKPNGQLNTNVSNISNATYFGGAATLYACWEPKVIKVNLDHANATTNYFGTTWLTAIAGSGVYIDVDETMTLMYPYSTDPQQQTGPAITLPRHIGDTVKFIMKCSEATGGPADQNPEWDFTGYYSSIANNAKECIDKMGYITSNTTNLNSFCLGSYNPGRTWHAGWIEKNTIKLPSVYNPGAGFFGCPNKIFDGWWTTASGNGTNVGSAGTSYTVPNGGNNLYARWSDCGYTGGANGTVAPGGTYGVGDDNSCIYTLTCNTNYACPDGNTSCTINGEANNPVVQIPDCTGSDVTITYYDNPAYGTTDPLHTQGYTYNSSGTVTLWTPGADILAAHHASSVTWCTNLNDDTTCVNAGGAISANSGDMILYAKWTCATGYSLDSNGVCAYSKYDVTYDCGAAGGQHTYSNSATFNSSYTVKTLAQAECPTTLAGYTFNGWHVEPANDDWNAGDTFTWEYTANQTFTAHWTPNKYRVILDKNASGAVAGTVGEIWEKWNNGWALTQDGTYNSAQTLSGNQLPTRTGYTFAGYWDTSASSGGNQKGSVSNGVWTTPPATAADVNPTTWYARWTPNQYTVTYNCGIGTGDGLVDNTPRYGQSYTPKTYAAAGCERPSNGYYFNGWNVTPGHSNSDIKNAGEAFGWDYTENQTFTARWVAKEYHITFNKNGGSGGTDEVWERYDSFWHDANQNHITTITLPNWSGHTFAGYAFNGNTVISEATLPASTLDFGDTSNNSTVDITLVAQWDMNTYNITYDENGGSRGLPTGYTLLEYVDANADAYINTNVAYDSTKEIIVNIVAKSDSTPSSNNMLALGFGNSAGQWFGVSSGGKWTIGDNGVSNITAANKTSDIQIRWNGGTEYLSINGASIGSRSATNTSASLQLFGRNNSGTFNGKIYFAQVIVDGTVVRNFVPAKNGNVVGMYDTITKTFFTNAASSGSFVAGGTVTQNTDAYPTSYTYGVGAKVYGVPTRAHSVFMGWCGTENSSGGLSNCQTMPYTISTTVTGNKTLHAKWTCEDGYTQSSNKQSCVANNITLDWNENGGVGLTNGSCTYNGNLTLAGAPTYADHVFNGWKTYGTSGIFAANTQITGGCTDTYTGVTSGTSTAITAQWCNACNPTNATCELNASVPGTCSYATNCNTGYDYQSGENTATPVCVPHTYTITYNVNGGTGSIANQSVEYLAGFDTNDATGISKTNSIVKSWIVVSGGNYTGVGTHYDHYDVASDTALKANWATCTCSHGSDVASCNTSASNNQCQVTVTCASGYDQSTASGSCEEENCSATCEAGRYTITLNKNNGTGGTTTLYTIYGTGSDAGVYINSARTNRMTPNPNGTYPIAAPTLRRTVSYDITSNGTVSDASFAQQPTTANTSAVATFKGYYISKTGTERYIESDKYINATGVSEGSGYTTNKTWYAQWTYGSVTLPVAYRPGYTLSGWSRTVGGTSVGNAGDSYTTGSNVTLYPVWTQCAAGTYCPGVETVNNQTVYNAVHDCPENYPNSAAGSTIISDCYLVLTPSKWVETAGAGMVDCTENYYCDDNTTKVYYSDEINDDRRTTGIRKSCAANAGSFSLSSAASDEIGDCYKNVTLNKRGGSGTLGGASGTANGSKECHYGQNCTLPDATVLQLVGHTFHGGWSQTDEDCDGTTRVFVVPDDVDTYYACRTTNSYTVTLKDGQNTGVTFATVNVNYGDPMPNVDSNGNSLVVPTHTPISPNTTHVFQGYFSTSGQSSGSGTLYYNANLTSARNWTTENDGTLYAKWYMKCNPGYYLPAGSYACAPCPAGRYCVGGSAFAYNPSTDKGLSGYIAAGYYSTGGASTSKPSGHVTSGSGCYGQVNGADTACGLVAGGYYSTGGGTSATPTAAGNGCLSGSGRSCGVLGAIYYSNGGGTNNAGACVTGQTCGVCPTNYRSNSATGKTAITQCTAGCSDGQWIMTAENPTVNNPSAEGCTTSASNYIWSKAHTVAYGSASPSVSDPNAAGRHSCQTLYRTPTTYNASDHDDQSDCTRSVPLFKNGGATVDGAVWPDNVTDDGGTDNASATCAEGATCNFGNPAELLEQTGYTFQANWGTNADCASTVGTSVTTPTNPRYYACKTQNNYTLTYSCGTGTGTAPNQQTNIHYGDAVSVSGAGGCAKTGHTFAGWTVSGTSDVITATTWPHDITWNYDGSKTFTAQWTANTYNITYDENGGSRLTLPDGYTLLEYVSGGTFDTGLNIGTDDIFEVKYATTAASTAYQFGYRGASSSSSANSFHATYSSSGSQVALLAVNSESAAKTFKATQTIDVPLTIRWNGSVDIRPTANGTAMSVSGSTTEQTNPSQTFVIGGEKINGTVTKSSKVMKIYYFRTFDSDGVSVTHNFVPVRNGSGVFGMYDTITGTFLNNMSNQTLSGPDATDTQVIDDAYPKRYTYGVGATVTGGAARANSVFQAWCRTASLTNCAAPHEITTTDTGYITLYAKWGCVAGYHDVDNQCVANEFTLVYDASGHGTTPDNQTCTYGQEITLRPALSETGWNFNGWTIAGENYVGGAPIICNEQYLGVTGGTVNVNVNVTADWSASCNQITLNKNNSGASYGSIRYLYAKTRENGSTVDGKWYKNSTCTTEYTSADYANVIPTRSDGWTFRGFYANLSDAADINATQTNGANRVITHTGTPTSITGQNFINNLNAPATLYAGWAKDCAGVNGTCVRTLGTNTSYTTSCATGYHYGTAPNGVTYNPASNTSESTYYPNCVPNTITIILDKNGGTGTCGGQSGTTSGTLTCAYDDTCNTPTWVSSPSCRLTQSGKIFAGWNTAADGTGTQYGTATVTGDVQNINDGTTTTTLYAVWQDVVCNVTNGTATPSVRNNYPLCSVSCNNGYGVSGGVSGTQHEWIVDTGQCNASTYDINYELYGGSRVEPNGYTLLEYVTADGNQYIDTGIAIKKSYEIRSKFEPTATDKFLYGVRSATSNDTASATAYIGGSWRWGNRYKTPTVSLNTIHTSVQNVSNVAVDDVAMSYTAQSADFTTPNTLLFGTSRNYDGISTSRFIGNIYEFRILDGNRNDLMNLVPMMRNSDGIAGFYDTVSGTFFTSTSGTAFIAGPRVSNAPEGYTFLDYIESDGGQKIDTEIMGLNKRVVLDAQYTGTSVTTYKIPVGYYGDYLGTYLGVYSNQWAVYSSQTVGTATNRTIFSVVFDMNGEKNRATLTVNGTTKTYTRSNAQPDATLKLFTSRSSSGAGSYGFIGRIYSARIYDKDTNELLFDGVPARQDSDGALGVYDMVSGDFFPNIAEGTFVAGPSINGAYPEHYTYGIGANVYGVPVRANSVFEGWCRNAALTDGCTMVPHTIGTDETGIKVLHAKWGCVDGYHLGANNQCVGNTITINYQNGGHGGNPWNPQTCTYGTQTNLGGAMFDSGYVFSGWELNDEVYDAEENISCNYDTLGVYSGSVAAVAVWDAQAFTVTYDCNTSWTPNNAPASQNTQTDAQFTVKSNTCVNPGYRFVKWAVSGTNPQEYKNENDQFIWGYTENKTFSAVWEIDDTDAFTVTVDMPANTEFKFNTIATGQFWVDWDDNSSIEEYAPTTITTKTWTHTYATAGTYVIKVGGRATGYAVSANGTPETKPAISFFNGTLSDSTSIDATVTASGTEQYITAVSGKLSAIFPTITAGSWGGQPRFYRTFKNTTAMTVSLQSIADLFDGISGAPVHYMFAETFDGSAVTGAIPTGLFPVSGAPKTALFMSTFRNCTGLTGTIPANLFVNISGAPAASMFSRTFRGCTGLTGIPAGLFRNISGAPAEAMFYATFFGCTHITGTLSSNLFGSLNGPIAKDMFRSTFYNCTSLVGDASDSTVAIPNGMFGTLTASTTAATRAFYATFYGCAALRGKIGGALFGGLTGNPAEYMFSNTFNTCGDRDITTNCSNLNGNIPTNLFGNMTGAPKPHMFNATFKGASKLTGAIPSKLFGTITGAPATSMFKETFKGCSGLTGIIPANLFENISGLPAGSMFYSTFYGCRHLSGIGGALFSGISGRAVSSMFFTTFYNCSGLTGSIPAGLFGTPTTPANWMFSQTFYGCSGLTGEIPSGLFGSVSGPAAEYMFDQTFRGCSGLTGTIPSDLFGTLSEDGKEGMFRRTFQGCSHLTGYVPEGLFGTMTVPSDVPTDMMTKVFAGSGLDTVCPCGTTEVQSDFKRFWDSTTGSANPKKVSCRVGLKPGEHWYNGNCTTECSDTAIDELHVGNLDPYVVLTDPVSTVKNLAVKHNDTICYVPVASGNGGTNSLNMKYGNAVYHADRPNDTPPAGFGQR